MEKEKALLEKSEKGQDERNEVVQVIAPADLREGYHFEAEANGRKFMVVVVSTLSR